MGLNKSSNNQSHNNQSSTKKKRGMKHSDSVHFYENFLKEEFSGDVSAGTPKGKPKMKRDDSRFFFESFVNNNEFDIEEEEEENGNGENGNGENGNGNVNVNEMPLLVVTNEHGQKVNPATSSSKSSMKKRNIHKDKQQDNDNDNDDNDDEEAAIAAAAAAVGSLLGESDIDTGSILRAMNSSDVINLLSNTSEIDVDQLNNNHHSYSDDSDRDSDVSKEDDAITLQTSVAMLHVLKEMTQTEDDGQVSHMLHDAIQELLAPPGDSALSEAGFEGDTQEQLQRVIQALEEEELLVGKSGYEPSVAASKAQRLVQLLGSVMDLEELTPRMNAIKEEEDN